MANTITKADLSDIDIISADELISDGYNTLIGRYLTSTLVSTNSGTKEVEINLPLDGEGISYKSDHPAESGDIVWIYGTGSSDGYYTINTVLSNTSFITDQPINTSSGGDISFYFPPGATRVGFDPQNLNYITATNVQDAIEEIDAALGNINTTGPAGGDLDGYYPNPNVVDLTISGEQYGSILFFNGTNWVQLAPEDDGYVLTTHDVGLSPTWEVSKSLPAAIMPGQILVSGDDLTFQPTFPLVNDNGFILIGDDGRILIPS